ncbi:MAG: metallophosphoesterase [Cytophagales bacterium]|nr:metallophosphoesterase [Armatimonadota bacterium]
MAKRIVVGDLHGDTDSLFRLLDAEQPDCLLCVGDWGDPDEIAPPIWDALLSRVPVLSVFGNHDDLLALATLRNHSDGSPMLLAQGERREFCGLSVAGVSGIWAKTNRLPHYVTDEGVAAWASSLAPGPTTDLLLTHGCPIGVADRTPSGRPGGQRCFLDLLRMVRPRIHLCGHLHVAQRRDLDSPPCGVLNTGSLRDGHYVILTGTGEALKAQACRLGHGSARRPDDA